jgi:hypothetical protein
MERRLQGRTERSDLPEEPWLFLWPKGPWSGEWVRLGEGSGSEGGRRVVMLGGKLDVKKLKRAPVDSDG